jgi:hypothetical protein
MIEGTFKKLITSDCGVIAAIFSNFFWVCAGDKLPV